jgi:hypothetical protein
MNVLIFPPEKATLAINMSKTMHRKAKVRWVGFAEPGEFDRTLVYPSRQANTSNKKLLIPRWDQRCQKTEAMQVPLAS